LSKSAGTGRSHPRKTCPAPDPHTPGYPPRNPLARLGEPCYRPPQGEVRLSGGGRLRPSLHRVNPASRTRQNRRRNSKTRQGQYTKPTPFPRHNRRGHTRLTPDRPARNLRRSDTTATR